MAKDVVWPRLLCPHCGNRESFDFEITARIMVDVGGHGLDAAIVAPGGQPDILELPFNSRVWCGECGKQGRWNSWQRGAYQDVGGFQDF